MHIFIFRCKYFMVGSMYAFLLKLKIFLEGRGKKWKPASRPRGVGEIGSVLCVGNCFILPPRGRGAHWPSWAREEGEVPGAVILLHSAACSASALRVDLCAGGLAELCVRSGSAALPFRRCCLITSSYLNCQSR